MADVTSTFSSLSSTEGSNNPSGATNVGTGLDDNLRMMQAHTAAWRDQTGWGGLNLTSVAGTNTITATLASAGSVTFGPTAYAAGQRFIFTPAVTNTGAATINITSPAGGSALGAKNIFSGGVSLRGGELVAGIPVVILYDGTQFNIVASGVSPPMVDPDVCQGRLTLTSGLAVTVSDVTAAETIYFTPYKGNKISLYTGSTWKMYTFSELSGDVPDATQMNDVFVYDNSGTLTLDIVAWSSDTARATALTTQDGVYVKSGATGRRYLGSFYGTTAGNGQTEDSNAKRYVWNYYNRVLRRLLVQETTDSWTYTLATYQQARNNAANQVDLVIGVSEDVVTVRVFALASSDQAAATVNMAVGIGIDSSTVNAALILHNSNNFGSSVRQSMSAEYRAWPGVGRRTFRWLEQSTAAGTTTWFGDAGADTIIQSGITGELLG